MSLFYKNFKTYLLTDSLVSYCAHAFISKQKLEIKVGFLYKMYFLPHPKAETAESKAVRIEETELTAG